MPDDTRPSADMSAICLSGDQLWATIVALRGAISNQPSFSGDAGRALVLLDWLWHEAEQKEIATFEMRLGEVKGNP